MTGVFEPIPIAELVRPTQLIFRTACTAAQKFETANVSKAMAIYLCVHLDTKVWVKLFIQVYTAFLVSFSMFFFNFLKKKLKTCVGGFHQLENNLRKPFFGHLP